MPKPKSTAAEPQKSVLPEAFAKELSTLRDRLLNLSARNRAIRLPRLEARWTFDLSVLNLFGGDTGPALLRHCLTKSTPRVILPKPLSDKEVTEYKKYAQRLLYLHRSMNELQKEKGLHDLYIGFPFLVGKLPGSDTFIQAPIFLLPVTLGKVKSRKSAPEWALSGKKDMPLLLNKTLLLALSKFCALNVNPLLFEEEMAKSIYSSEEFIAKTCRLLASFGLNCVASADIKEHEFAALPELDVPGGQKSRSAGKFEVCGHGVLGHFPQSNSSIHHEYDKFFELDVAELSAISCFFATDVPCEEKKTPASMSGQPAPVTIDDRPESENVLLLPSDSSQDRILLELANPKTTGLVIWGPPGTGKSQTIVNLIGDCVARKKSVLVVSQKRAALDVVYERLGTKGLTSLVALVHDSKTDRANLFAQIARETDLGTETAEKLGALTPDPSREMERISQLFKDAARAYNDDIYGIKLGEMYRRLGGAKERALPLDAVFWKGKTQADVVLFAAQLRSLQAHVREASHPVLLKHRKPFFAIENHEVPAIKSNLEALLGSDSLQEARTLLALKEGALAELSAEETTTQKLKDFWSSLLLYREFKSFTRYLNVSFWRAYFQMKKHVAQAHAQVRMHAAMAHTTLTRILDSHAASHLVSQLHTPEVEHSNFKELAAAFSDHFYHFKSYDIALEAMDPKLRSVAKQIECAIADKHLSATEDWGRLLERSVHAIWAAELEQKYAIVSLIRSGQMDVLRQQYKELLKKKSDYSVAQLKERVILAMATPESVAFRREINADVNKLRNTYSIRKLNEKYIARPPYRTLLPVWLVSPESISDVFPLQKDLFDVVIFDEASQCPVEHALPAIFRGKQVVIAGDEKQLPPSQLFEAAAEENDDEESENFAVEESSLLTLAKKTLHYKSHMLEWHYRSRHQELITFSNEGFYNGRMRIAPNVVPFKKGNKPAIAWHQVDGYWQDRTNRAEAELVVERIAFFLKQNPAPTLGVITFNAPQKDLILDLIEERQIQDPEFAALIQENETRPVDAQLFVKNIENVQGDEREVILFSVTYARSEPNGRVYQYFGALNAKGGENRLNVAVTRAVKRIEVVASIDPERDLNVAGCAHAGPRVLKNYLRFAHAVAHEDFARVNAILAELNPHLQTRMHAGAHVVESPFEAEVLSELQNLGYEVHTQVGQSGFRIDMAVVHPRDGSRYLLGIECDGALFHSGMSVRERDVFRQTFLEDRGWKIHRVWSTCWWDNKQKEVAKLKAVIEGLLS